MKVMFFAAAWLASFSMARAQMFEGLFPGQTRTEGRINLALRWCPPGQFVMGSPEGEPGRDHDETLHPVRLTSGFWMGETEVTQGQWKTVTGLTLRDQARLMLADTNLYRIGGKDITLRESMGAGKDAVASVSAAEAPNIPIYYVSWDDATAFCRKLTEMERAARRLPPDWAYVLPTEAQWEYACRAGTATATYAGEMKVLGENNAPVLNKIAWYGGNSTQNYAGRGWSTKHWPNKAIAGDLAGPRRVGQLQPNAWGLRDMLGNVYEWVADFSAYYPERAVTDPTGPATGSKHTFRGGSWNHYGTMSRAARRFEELPTYRCHYLGFRVALVRPAR